jgi:hypothetical protein
VASGAFRGTKKILLPVTGHICFLLYTEIFTKSFLLKILFIANLHNKVGLTIMVVM